MSENAKIKLKKIFCAAAFLAIAAACVSKLNEIFVYKNFYNHAWPTTSCYKKFYDMKKNSVDVLFFGSSLYVCSFYPHELYKQHRITSYNLGCEQQNLVVAYYWLLEALKYQSPNAVVIEPSYIVRSVNSPLVTGEGLIRKAIDPMRWSKNKWNAVKDICRLDQSQKPVNYLVPTLRFHSRWKYLAEDDFSYKEMSAHENLLGATVFGGESKRKYVPFVAGSNDDKAKTNETQKEYLSKMIEVCKKNGIKVLLCHTPEFGNISQFNAIMEFAKENGVPFLDFNEEKFYNAAGYDIEKDNQDGGHPNFRGAKKLSDCMGNFLKRELGVRLRINNSFYESENAFYKCVLENLDLSKTWDINKYLPALKRSRYAIFVSVRDEASAGLSDAALKCLSDLGLKKSLKGKWRQSYFAVLEGGKVLAEEIAEARISKTGSVRGGRSLYKIESAGLPYGNFSQIVIDGKNHSKNRRGLNIVVYDTEMRRVIDSVCFDTCDKAMRAFR